MIDLSTLVARARATVEATTKLDTAKAKIKTAKSSIEETEAQAEVDALQVTIDWRPVYLVLQQEVWTCGCGAKGFSPQGLFIYQEHTRMHHCWRLVRPRNEADAGNNLPRRIKTISVEVFICHSCAAESNFLEPYRDPIPPAPAATRLTAQGEYILDWRAKTAAVPDEEGDSDAA